LEIALNPSVEARLFVFSECCDRRHQLEKLLAHGGSQAAASSTHVTALGASIGGHGGSPPAILVNRSATVCSARYRPREYAARLTHPVGDYGSF
jgi:hypothetical protein